MNDIEVEIRSFLTEERFNLLMERLKLEGEYLGQDEQTTYYLDSEKDVRIQKNSRGGKIWMKDGRLHDEHRKEIEVPIRSEDFEKMEEIFLNLGYGIDIKWYRTRNTFDWKGVKVMMDRTKGYGHIIELEKMSSDENKLKTLNELKILMFELGVTQSPKHEFQEKYDYYKSHWRELVEEKEEKIKDPV